MEASVSIYDMIINPPRFTKQNHTTEQKKTTNTYLTHKKSHHKTHPLEPNPRRCFFDVGRLGGFAHGGLELLKNPGCSCSLFFLEPGTFILFPPKKNCHVFFGGGGGGCQNFMFFFFFGRLVPKKHWSACLITCCTENLWSCLLDQVFPERPQLVSWPSHHRAAQGFLLHLGKLC